MPRQIDFKSVVSKLQAFRAERRRLPSFSELQDLLGYRSKGSVAALVRHLVSKRILEKDAEGRLVPLPALDGGPRLLGTVQAGWPSPAEEEMADVISLDRFLIPSPDSSYLLKVSGDSMIDAGILPGDLVVVQRGRTPRHGDIVIAQVDGDWTMKYFEKRGEKVLLRAANKKYPPFEAKAEIVVAAIVTGVVRKYGR